MRLKLTGNTSFLFRKYPSLIGLMFFSLILHAQDTTESIKNIPEFNGQFSTWLHYNSSNQCGFYCGGRYIPTLHYDALSGDNYKIDFETSANLYGTLGFCGKDSLLHDGEVNPYRAWMRFSGKQFEFRAGLQKINFGSAVMLRSLRWFDQVDVRDPLQMTNGVWAALGRYYFLNNANLWLWCLYGNKETKGLELIKTKHNVPEIGGRIQYPVPSGEAAFTYHYRQADSRNLEGMLPGYALIPENRIGVDVKWDKFIGFWIEGVWVNKQKNVEMFTNSEMFTAGMDYTFAIGNGLTMMLEHMFLSYSEEAFSFDNNYNFTGLSFVYPIGMFDRINVMPYYDWLNESAYLFFYWQKEFNNLSLYLMGYINPEKNNIPMMAGSENLFGGTGVQFMFVYNH